MKEEKLCGCNCHSLDMDDPNLVVLNDKTWLPLCALRETFRTLAKTEEKLAKTKEKLTETERELTRTKEKLEKFLIF